MRTTRLQSITFTGNGNSLRAAQQQGVEYGHGCHGLDHGDCAGYDAGIMTSVDFECDVVAAVVDAIQRTRKCRHRLESHTEDDVGAVRDASLNAARVVCARSDTAV